MTKLLSTEKSKKRRLYIKLCKIRLYSFRHRHHHHHHNHHHCRQHRPRKTNITHRRQTAGWGRMDSQSESCCSNLSPKKQASAISTDNAHTMSELYMSVFLSGQCISFQQSFSNVLIYNSLSLSVPQKSIQ